jgi:hypothetical protein
MWESEDSMMRMIFHDSQALEAKEQEALEGFRKYIKDNNLNLPHG